MSHYLKNIAAKNLNLTEVIRPRLASRFEPAPKHILPAERSLQGPDGEPAIALHVYAQDNDASNYNSLDNHAKATAKNLVRSRSALADQDPDSSGPATLAETESNRARRPQSSQKRSMLPIYERKMPFSPSVQSEGDMQANFETARLNFLPPEEITSGHSSISGSFGMASSPGTDNAREMVQKAKEKIGREYQTSPQEPSPFAPIEEDQTTSRLGNEMKSTGRTSRGPRQEQIVSLSIPEGKQVSSEKTDLILKVVDRSISEIRQRKEEVASHGSIEKNEQKIGTERSIRQKTAELIAGLKPLMPLVSPGMVAAQPYVKSYFKQEGNEIPYKVANPENSAPVQVTIGRIEIRATPATATPQRKRADPPVMSLEDYLKIKRGSL